MAEQQPFLADKDIFDDAEAQVPRSEQTGFCSAGARKMRRLLSRATRKHIFVASVFICMTLLVVHGSRSPSTYTQWAPPNVFSCHSARSNPHSIKSPSQPDSHFLSKTWTSLNELFDSHRPAPARIPMPAIGQRPQPPSEEEIKKLVNLTSDEALRTRTNHAKVLQSLPEYPKGQFKGQGIVTLAGGRYSEFAATTLGMLREVGSRLPVEVWIKDHTEEKDGWCAELEKEGMACRKLVDYMGISTLAHPYQWKVFTMLFSSFQEIIFLDADDIPVRNPDVLLKSNVYHRTGAILWPDYWMHTGTPWLPYLTGLSDQPSDMLLKERSVESGQIVWHKERHWKSLLLAVYYNYIGPEYFYTIFNSGWSGWGDKDTFPMALKAAQEDYYQVPHNIVTVRLANSSFLGIAMAQADPRNETGPETMFLHSNMVKWSMRDFLCQGCAPLWGQKEYKSHLENPSSLIHSHLKENRRIFESEVLLKQGIDPEPLLWKAVEHTACRSAAWGNEQLCERGRNHMRETFGFSFKPTRFGESTCVVDP